jgi:hypothetical protein
MFHLETGEETPFELLVIQNDAQSAMAGNPK